MAKATIQLPAGPDRTLAGQWEEQNDVQPNDRNGYPLRSKKISLAGFEHYSADVPGNCPAVGGNDREAKTKG
jgi:hypothetical protein